LLKVLKLRHPLKKNYPLITYGDIYKLLNSKYDKQKLWGN
jgi:hypothetical protein